MDDIITKATTSDNRDISNSLRCQSTLRRAALKLLTLATTLTWMECHCNHSSKHQTTLASILITKCSLILPSRWPCSYRPRPTNQSPWQICTHNTSTNNNSRRTRNNFSVEATFNSIKVVAVASIDYQVFYTNVVESVTNSSMTQ